MALGRPSKYTEEIRQEIFQLLSTEDLLVREICGRVGIGESTWHEWTNTFADFSELIIRAEKERRKKFVSDAREGLTKLSTGFETEEITYERQITGEEIGEDGKMQPRYEMIPTKRVKKNVAPNPAAVQFVLRNLDKVTFPDVQRQDITTNGKELETFRRIVYHDPEKEPGPVSGADSSPDTEPTA